MSSRVFRDDLYAGKVAIVTGGGTGIGAATARELGKLGATVVIASRKAENVDPAVKGLTEELGRPVFGATCDIRDRVAVRTFIADVVARHGRVDLLVNNGGGQFFAPAETISDKGFDAVVATNLAGTWNMTRAVADAWMLAHGGSIVNVTMLTSRAFPGMAHSVAARAGVEAMSRTLAVEWAARNVRVNCIAPGLVLSSGFSRYPAGLEMIATMRTTVPMKRFASCEEIAWWIAFVGSEAGAYVTGQTLTVDGGKTLWGDWWPIADPAEWPKIELPKEPWET